VFDVNLPDDDLKKIQKCRSINGLYVLVYTLKLVRLLVPLIKLFFNTRGWTLIRLILFCTMANKCTIISQIITLLRISTLSCHPQGACNQYLTKLCKYIKCSCW